MSGESSLYKAAVDAIQEVFGDTSVSKRQTKNDLQGLIDHTEVLIESIGEDDDDNLGDDDSL